MSHSSSDLPQQAQVADSRLSVPTMIVWLPIGFLWFRLIANLQVEWETNPQYSYGYIVPFLCLGLIIHRWQGRDKVEVSGPENHGRILRPSAFRLWFVFALLAFCYLPTRLIELATPEWRPIQWALGFIAIGLTLHFVAVAFGRGWLRLVAFPVGMFLIAIPWPTLIEQPVIQFLTRINASLVIEVMGIMGIPAVQHGNVIEVSTGVVGIDEACSGIRSFQSSIMISLFLGALYDLTPLRRVLFVPIGFALAMFFNLVRTALLTFVAARQGLSAIDKYHDPAGLWILVGCTVGLWLIGLLLRRKRLSPDSEPGAGQPSKPLSERFPASLVPTAVFHRLGCFLFAWLVCVELGAHAWYHYREAQLPRTSSWSLELPTQNASFRELPMAAKTMDLLRFDTGKQGAWTDPDGLAWQVFYFDWRPGRVAGYLAKRHTPEICMPATGRQMISGPELMVVRLHGLQLPIRRYRFGPEGNSWHVYHCRWDAGATDAAFVEQESARFNLIRGIWAGRGNQGQKIIQVLISGTEDPELAKTRLIEALDAMIRVAQP